MLLYLKYHIYNINRTFSSVVMSINLYLYARPVIELLVVVLRPRSNMMMKMENLHIHNPLISATIEISLYVIDTVDIGTALLGLIPDTHTTELPFRSSAVISTPS